MPEEPKESWFSRKQSYRRSRRNPEKNRGLIFAVFMVGLGGGVYALQTEPPQSSLKPRSIPTTSSSGKQSPVMASDTEIDPEVKTSTNTEGSRDSDEIIGNKTSK